MALTSWSCKGCTNTCYKLFEGKVYAYCSIENNRTEWQGDYLACLDYTTDPDAEDKQVRIGEWEY